MVPTRVSEWSSGVKIRIYLNRVPVFPGKWVLSFFEALLALRKALISGSLSQ